MSAFDVSSSKSKPGDRPGFEILSLFSIRRYQNFAVKTVSQVLKVSEDDAFFLLKRYRWCGDHLFEAWFEGVLDSSLYVERSIDASDDDKLSCLVCLEEHSIRKAAPIRCGHPCCSDCLRELISVAARGGPSSILNMECPTSDCKRNIGLCVTDSVASPEDAAVFHKFAILSYVDNNSKIKWCPAPDCNHAIAQKDKEENDMECFKMHRFCWKCLREPHYPVDCSMVAKMEEIDWKSVNVKKCPNCLIPIQLSEGCPHITCRCKFEFCWTCSSKWTREHVQVFCEPPAGESDEISDPSFPSESDTYYRNLFVLREQLLAAAIRDSTKFCFGYSRAIKLAWFEIRRCTSISKWICAFAHQHRLEVNKFVGIKAKSEHHLEDLVAAASTKMSEVDLLDRTKKTRQSYDSMVAQLQWEAAW